MGTNERKTSKKKKRKKRGNVPFELHKRMSKIIITVKKKSRIRLVKLVITTTISVISSKKGKSVLKWLLSGDRYFWH